MRIRNIVFLIAFMGLGPGCVELGKGLDADTIKDTLTTELPGLDVDAGRCSMSVVSPNVLDFGKVETPDSKLLLELTVTNQGASDLIIQPNSVHPTPGSDPDLKVQDPPATILTLKSGQSHVFHIAWSPTKANPSSYNDLGAIAIGFQDGCSIVVPVKGLVDAAILIPIPAKVDFGTVGRGVTVKHTIELKNLGTKDLIIHSVVIKGDANNEFATNASVAVPAETTIQSGKKIAVDLTFTNKGADNTDAIASLEISSNSVTGDTTTLDLTAHRAARTECNLVLSPPVLNYGTVPEQMHKTLVMYLRNDGTGPCTFKDAGIWDCNNVFGMPNCQTPFDSSYKSKIYKAGSLPSQDTAPLQPGDQIDIPIVFTPPQQGAVFGDSNEYDALFAVKVYDEFTKKESIYPAGSGVGNNHKWGPNLMGMSGTTHLTATPSIIDFGKITIGCYSKTYEICVSNTGTASIDITGIKTTNCSPGFHLKDVPVLPFSVSIGNTLCFKTNYAPSDETTDSCSILITGTNNASLSVGLTGFGTYKTHQKDEFTQVSGMAVDILFVIDDSGSMSDKQRKLRDSMDRFINALGNNYHLGVISVCAEDSSMRGKLNLGFAQKLPRFVTSSTPDGKNLFKKYVLLGDNSPGGCSDMRESGLEAARAALSAPLITDTGKACTKDADCTDDVTLCPDPNTCLYSCVDRTCAGWNKGFLRKNARLEVLVLSDEEDQSNGSVDSYIKFFKGIKGPLNTDMFHWNSIVGMDESTGDCAKGCTGPDGTSAEHGCRYVKVSQDTDGTIGSICDSDYNAVADEISSRVSGMKLQFFLTRPADPSTIQVHVMSTDCGSGYTNQGVPQNPGWNWRYNQSTNSVIFEANGKCTPKSGDKITIEYDTICLTK